MTVISETEREGGTEGQDGGEEGIIYIHIGMNE